MGHHEHIYFLRHPSTSTPILDPRRGKTANKLLAVDLLKQQADDLKKQRDEVTQMTAHVNAMDPPHFSGIIRLPSLGFKFHNYLMTT